MAHEDDPVRAVHCAIEIRKALKAIQVQVTHPPPCSSPRPHTSSAPTLSLSPSLPLSLSPSRAHPGCCGAGGKRVC
eukprot:560818-Rhodomonas_salina.1